MDECHDYDDDYQLRRMLDLPGSWPPLLLLPLLLLLLLLLITTHKKENHTRARWSLARLVPVFRRDIVTHSHLRQMDLLPGSSASVSRICTSVTACHALCIRAF